MNAPPRVAALSALALLVSLGSGCSAGSGAASGQAPTRPFGSSTPGGAGAVSAFLPYSVDPPQAPYATQPAPLPDDRVIVRYNLAVPMRDGAILRADVYWPDTPGTFPVLMTRTPYNKDAGGNLDMGLRGAQRGFIMVNMDVRGRYASPGEWYPFKHEIADGYDSVEWAARLPHSDGKVGMWGSSYDGATQFLAALANPPHLAGIFPVCTASNYYKDWAYESGALQQYFGESWAAQLEAGELDHRTNGADPMMPSPALPLGNYTALQVPSIAGHAGLEALAPWYLDWIKHPSDDAYWEQWAIDKDYSRIHVPVYQLGGWYDLFLYGTLSNYAGIKANAGTDAARRGERLLIIPGGHSGWSARVGVADFNPSGYVDYNGVMMDWYDAILRGLPNGVLSEKPVRYFVMGTNTWREADTWPPPGAQTTAYYLGSRGHAQTAVGDGALATATPAFADPAERFTYDPAHPVPTRGGKLCCELSNKQPPVAGVADQRPDEARPDVLVYSTPPLTRDLVVTGPVTLTLYVSSTAPDTDFIATLTDVAPDGTSYNLTDGIVRMRYRQSLQQPSFITTGQVYKINLDLWATSNVFRAGHRLRLDISSSNYPRFDVNLNTRVSPEAGVRGVKATNTIYHDAAHPSALWLPVVPQ